jgi:cytoskeletal protein RodZ
MNEIENHSTEPEAEIPPALSSPAKTIKTPPESKTRRFFVRTLRWVVGLLIVFVLGFLVAVYTLYIPGRQSLINTQAQLDTANATINELETRLIELNPLKTQNQTALENLQTTEMHLTILSARLDVANALLALMKDEPEKARLVLNNTADTLLDLENLVQTDQRKIVTEMQSRLALALTEIDQNSYAAQSDLDVLATSLMELENVYFTRP